MTNKRIMKKYIRERDAVLITKNPAAIKKFLEKWNVPYPQDSEIFMIGMHMAIVNDRNMPEKIRDGSAAWLIEHKYKTTEEK